MLSVDKTLELFSIEGLHKQVIHIVLRVAREKGLLVEQREGQALKALEKPLHELPPDLFCLVLWLLSLAVSPVEDVSGIVDLVVFHVAAVAPDTGFDEVDLELLLPFEFH